MNLLAKMFAIYNAIKAKDYQLAIQLFSELIAAANKATPEEHAAAHSAFAALQPK